MRNSRNTVVFALLASCLVTALMPRAHAGTWTGPAYTVVQGSRIPIDPNKGEMIQRIHKAAAVALIPSQVRPIMILVPVKQEA